MARGFVLVIDWPEIDGPLSMASATEAEGQLCDGSIWNEFIDALADLFAAET